MEARMKKYRQVSPERAKVWTEKSPKYQQSRKVPVVYYLCRNRQLEHPHFIEVPLSSTEGLYLRDVIDRLNVLRGRGMASMYSWSCKRSYKNGFVWHDISEDDIILPAHGNEYVLKGSELFESNSGRFSPVGNIKIQNPRPLPETASSRSHDDSSSTSSMNGKETKNSQEDDLSPPLQRPGSSGLSPGSRVAKDSSWGGSLSLTEYKICKGDGATDASTQTEENVSKPKARETCTRGVSTDDGSLEAERNEIYQNQVPCMKENSEICRESISPLSTSSASSSGGKTETLDSLIRADACKINSFRILEEEEVRMAPVTKLKATNMLMQLISCGSISVKDHSFGLIPTYRPRFSHSKFPSPLFSTSIMLGELDCFAENPRMMGLNKNPSKVNQAGRIRYWKNVGLGFTTPKSAMNGRYIDKKCPFTGDVSIRGRIIRGVCHSTKMKRSVVLRRNYLHFVSKYQRYQKRHKNFTVHCSPAFEPKVGDDLIAGQCRSLSKTITYNVLAVVSKSKSAEGKKFDKI